MFAAASMPGSATQAPAIDAPRYEDGVTDVSEYDSRVVAQYRRRLRETLQPEDREGLADAEYLRKKELLVQGHLTRAEG